MSLENKKIQSWDEAAHSASKWRSNGESVVFTNGCFDILHPGHVAYLQTARSIGDRLIIGLNSDESVVRLKGPTRPIVDELARGFVLAGLACVDAVVVFDQETPLELINHLKPDVLVKGGDYTIDTIVGAKEVQSWGGKVQVIPFEEGYSTSNIIDKIKSGS